MTKYPDYDKILSECRAEMDAKDEAYGSMWLDYDGKEHWIRRLMNEVKEADMAFTIPEERRKYVNIVNLAVMAWQMRERARQ